MGRAGLSVIGIIRAEVRVMGRPERRAFVLVRGCAGAIRVLTVVVMVILVMRAIRAGLVLRAVVVMLIVQRVFEVKD